MFPKGDAAYIKDVEGIVSCKPFVPIAVFVCKDGISMTQQVCIATSHFKISTRYKGTCQAWRLPSLIVLVSFGWCHKLRCVIC